MQVAHVFHSVTPTTYLSIACLSVEDGLPNDPLSTNPTGVGVKERESSDKIAVREAAGEGGKGETGMIV